MLNAKSAPLFHTWNLFASLFNISFIPNEIS